MSIGGKRMERKYNDMEWRKHAANAATKILKEKGYGKIKTFAELLHDFLQDGVIFVNRGELGITLENLSQAGYETFIPANQQKYAEQGIMVLSARKYKSNYGGGE